MSLSLQEVANEVFTYESLVHATSGMTGGMTAITAFYPLNIIRMKLQVDEALKSESMLTMARKIAKKDGVGALYQGWWSSVVSLGASNFVYFYAYNAMKTVYRKIKGHGPKVVIDPITNLVIASVAGVINVLMTTPLWVVGTRLSTQSKVSVDNRKPYTGIMNCLLRIQREEGVNSLWKGVGSSLILVSNPTVQFFCYERIRGIMVKIAERRGWAITSIEFFIMGAIAKTVATVLTYPIQLAQSRLRADKGTKEDPTKRIYSGTADVLIKVYRKEGLMGWMKGIEAKTAQTVLTASLMFMIYEKLQQIVFKILMPKKSIA